MLSLVYVDILSICCGSILSSFQFVFFFVLHSFSYVTTHNIEPRMLLNHNIYLYHAQNKAPLFVVLYWVEIITEFIFKSKHLEGPWQYALVCQSSMVVSTGMYNYTSDLYGDPSLLSDSLS